MFKRQGNYKVTCWIWGRLSSRSHCIGRPLKIKKCFLEKMLQILWDGANSSSVSYPAATQPLSTVSQRFFLIDFYILTFRPF